MGKDKVGIALVGLGNYSTNLLAPAFKETEHCYLAGIVTGSDSKAAEWAEKYKISDQNIYNYQNFDDIARNPDIDIVYIVLPNSMHAEYTIRAANAGKNVICEKPMAMNVIECRQMIDACDKAGVRLFVGYRLEYEPHHKKLMYLGQHEIFGKIESIDAAQGFNVGDKNQWRLKKEYGGGALMDVGIYCIQASRYITGMEPLSIKSASFGKIYNDVDMDISWELEFPHGIIANGKASLTQYMDYLKTQAEHGWFELEPAFDYGGLNGRTSSGPMDSTINLNQQATQMDAMAQCLLREKLTSATGMEGIKDIKIIEAIYQSAESGKSVDLHQPEYVYKY
jgi:predicted dehydrogenase